MEYSSSGKATGEADVHFDTHEDAVAAMLKDRSHVREYDRCSPSALCSDSHWGMGPELFLCKLHSFSTTKLDAKDQNLSGYFAYFCLELVFLDVYLFLFF